MLTSDQHGITAAADRRCPQPTPATRSDRTPYHDWCLTVLTVNHSWIASGRQYEPHSALDQSLGYWTGLTVDKHNI
jgi:hypothetical protein